jgi:hypothetical protein
MTAIFNLLLFIGAIVVVLAAAIVFFRNFRHGVWNALKKCLRVLYENLP